MSTSYLHHQVLASPLQWKAASTALAEAQSSALEPRIGAVYGIWRSQIGRPRDEVNVITVWTDEAQGKATMDGLLDEMECVVSHSTRAMVPTLRPDSAEPPKRQGNYAFRYFETPTANFDEFLELCASAWPGFESAYDSQVIGLWRYLDSAPGSVETLLLTRRPDLAMWERSKLPVNEAEAEVRRKLSRRYDLCSHTVVSTATLLTAEDAEDTARWT